MLIPHPFLAPSLRPGWSYRPTYAQTPCVQRHVMGWLLPSLLVLNFCAHLQEVFVEFNTLFRTNVFARRLVRSIFTASVLVLWHKHTHITLYAGTKLSAVKILWKYSNYFHSSLLHPRYLNLLKPTRHVMHHQFNIQQLYALSTLYLCVLYLSENKQRLVPLTA